MCGEHVPRVRHVFRSAGSSPHVRGALPARWPTMICSGIIPACAGSTGMRARWCQGRWDHPRMCGEHRLRIRFGDGFRGSSPHVRGAPLPPPTRRPRAGIIPACAGSTVLCRRRVERKRDHPRMCGEHRQLPLSAAESRGSSPHVRGALVFHVQRLIAFGIIPACAGSTRCPALRGVSIWDHPRMCGEHTSKIA